MSAKVKAFVLTSSELQVPTWLPLSSKRFRGSSELSSITHLRSFVEFHAMGTFRPCELSGQAGTAQFERSTHVISHSTNAVEHPEFVAELIVRFAKNHRSRKRRRGSRMTLFRLRGSA